MGTRNKHIRNRRLQDFQNHVLGGLRAYMKVESRKNGSYTLHTKDVGIIDFFPKSDKICFRSDNSWIKNGCEWICNNL